MGKEGSLTQTSRGIALVTDDDTHGKLSPLFYPSATHNMIFCKVFEHYLSFIALLLIVDGKHSWGVLRHSRFPHPLLLLPIKLDNSYDDSFFSQWDLRVWMNSASRTHTLLRPSSLSFLPLYHSSLSRRSLYRTHLTRIAAICGSFFFIRHIAQLLPFSTIFSTFPGQPTLPFPSKSLYPCVNIPSWSV